MPPPNTKVSEIGGYDILDYWEPIVTGVSSGDAGNNGWTPVYALENDGDTRVVQKLVAYVGGTGPYPGLPANQYIGSTGFVTKSLATNLKGSQGAPGDVLTVRPEAYFSVGIRSVNPPTDVWPAPGYVTGNLVEFSNAFHLSVINNWNQPRAFIIHAQVHLSNDSGADAWFASLHINSPSPLWTIVDENFSRQDFVNQVPRKSVHKIGLWYKRTLAPGQTQVFKVTTAQVNGGQSLRSNPFIEAWGL